MTNGGHHMSRQDILDHPASACPGLNQLLGGYFHQDWALEPADWAPVVDEFVGESPHSVVVATAAELSELLAAQLSDEELGAVLERLGSSLTPGAFGVSATAWLEAVLQRLRASP